ncbi:MAG TPA: glutamate formimidoyltransferase [Vicinamibacterales bacterium]
MSLIACVVNISEGRDRAVVDAIAAAATAVPGVQLLDRSSDPSHHRSVLTLAGDRTPLRAAVLALVGETVARIDLRVHRGAHPRIGAADVVPFVPIGETAMSECVALAHEVGREVAARFGVPVYFYEEAALSPGRRRLETIRRGGFEGLAARMALPEWAPDAGPREPHPTAGATVVGARQPLIAYNINLATDRVDVAQKIARAVRASSGGLRDVKAIGLLLEHRGIAQVSMNLTNHTRTPIPRVFELVKREAARYGVAVLESEIIGLVPQAALFAAAEYYLQIAGFTPDCVLEHRLRSLPLTPPTRPSDAPA